MTQFDKFRTIFINNLKRGELPILPAFFFYLEHTSNRYIMNQREFEELFYKGVNNYFHPITLSVKQAEMDIEEIIRILSNYYSVSELYNKEGELINIV